MKVELQHKGNTSALLHPEQEKALFSTVTIPLSKKKYLADGGGQEGEEE